MSREPTIPRKGISEPSVAVHRPSYTEPSSSSSQQHPEIQSQQQNQDDEQTNEPPPYSGPTSSAMTRAPAPQPQPTYPGLPRLNYSLYTPPTFTLSDDQKTLTSYSPELSIYPTKLISLIQSLATVPPKPQIRIIGKSSNGEVDFDVRLNLMNLIVPEEGKAGSGRMNYVKVIGKGEMGFRGEGKEALVPDLRSLEEWARRYCEDQNSIKRFVLDRTVINWDTSYLEGRLLSLISSTSYRGHVTLSFPLTHSRVVVHSPDKVNRFFSDVTKLFTGTKKYEVVKSVWPYADIARGENGGVGRRCAVQEEEVWFADWRDAIRHAIVAKRKGWVTVEDRLEFLMEPKPGEVGKPADWGSF
ncbi:hypothetical protein ONS95_001841 [Cadophora gregata]|uniref:uncharacterized protein n=1 Tax=Cadophora gregata TaxID=51156 RepID=UPI0026DAE494|nr:uncharacterized protein ONS95_001841 [Cadophora gregata]KAK0111486.1 hypothetical protein ONS95_001841 [Cadophora gregata]KAK0112038.1 hypothetical protein ONS96_001299 [Cadophora gregata f. sp. sojae]